MSDVSTALMFVGGGFVFGCIFMIFIFGLFLSSRDKCNCDGCIIHSTPGTMESGTKK